jgi:hypothetical protein
MPVLINLATDKHFGLVYVGHRGLEWNTTMSEKGEALSSPHFMGLLFSVSLY